MLWKRRYEAEYHRIWRRPGQGKARRNKGGCGCGVDQQPAAESSVPDGLRLRNEKEEGSEKRSVPRRSRHQIVRGRRLQSCGSWLVGMAFRKYGMYVRMGILSMGGNGMRRRGGESGGSVKMFW